MSNDFREFVEAEVKEILSSMDEKSRKNPKLRGEKAIQWIDENAEKFREQWCMNKKNIKTVSK